MEFPPLLLFSILVDVTGTDLIFPKNHKYILKTKNMIQKQMFSHSKVLVGETLGLKKTLKSN